MLYGMISAIGVRNVVENRVDLTKSRNLIIAVSFCMWIRFFGWSDIQNRWCDDHVDCIGSSRDRRNPVECHFTGQ